MKKNKTFIFLFLVFLPFSLLSASELFLLKNSILVTDSVKQIVNSKLKMFSGNRVDGRTTLYVPNLIIDREARVNRRKVLYKVRYTIDNYGRRRVPLNPSGRTKSIVLFGASKMFGHNVYDDQSIPFYLGKIMKDYMPYNYAVNGGSANNLYSIIHEADLQNQIPQAEGITIYLHYDYLIQRVQQSYGGLNKYYRGYEMNGSEIRRIPPSLYFKAIFLLKYGIFPNLVSYFFDDPPPTEMGYKLYFQLLKKAVQKYKKLFPNNTFYVAAITPSEKTVKSFRKIGIPFFLLPKIPRKYSFFPYDGHFNAKGDEMMAHNIVKALNKFKKNE